MSDFGHGGGAGGPFGPPQNGPFGPPQNGPFGPAQNAPQNPPPAQPQPQFFRPYAGWFEHARAAGYAPPPQELEHAFYAHLFAAIGAFLFCGTVFGAVAPLLVLAIAKQKGPFLLYHVNQAVVFQTIFFVVNTAIGVVGGVLSIVCIGYFILMLWPITWLLGFIYPLVVAFGAKSGEWNEYLWVGPKVRLEWKPLFT